MRVVLDTLRQATRPLTPDQIAVAALLDVAVVELALQRLLLRRLVVCGSYDPPGRGGQHARYIGEFARPVWSAMIDPE